MTPISHDIHLRAATALLVLFIVANLAGCGGGSGGGGDATGAVLVSSTPADGDSGVSTLVSVQAVFNDDFDVTALSDADVRLAEEGEPLMVKGIVSYDPSTRTAVFTPLTKVRFDTQYTFSVSRPSVTPTEQVAQLTFKTFVNPQKLSVAFDNSGAEAAYQRDSYDDEGRTLRSVTFIGPGTNGEWFDDDDQPSVYSEDSYDQDRHSRRTHYDAGLDAAWFNEDDQPVYYEDYRYDEAGRLRQAARYESPGDDEQWFTNDPVSAGFAYDYDLHGNLTHWRRLIAAGPDGQWFTEDDQADQLLVYRYDAEHHRTHLLVISDDANGDGGLTEADPPSSYLIYDHDENGNQTSATTYVDVLGDGVSADDTPVQYVGLEYDAGQNVSREISSVSPGSDDTWGTDDDLRVGCGVYRYNDLGNRVDFTQSRDPGADSVWCTNDDLLASRREYDTSL